MIAYENQKIAMKLLTMREDPNLSKRNLDLAFERNMKAKNIMCKLPVIDMAKNQFNTNTFDPRGSSFFEYSSQFKSIQASASNKKLSQVESKGSLLNKAMKKLSKVGPNMMVMSMDAKGLSSLQDEFKVNKHNSQQELEDVSKGLTDQPLHEDPPQLAVEVKLPAITEAYANTSLDNLTDGLPAIDDEEKRHKKKKRRYKVKHTTRLQAHNELVHQSIDKAYNCDSVNSIDNKAEKK